MTMRNFLNTAMVVGSIAVASACYAAGSATQTVNLEQMSKEQFAALPDSAVVEFRGKTATKGQLVSDAARKAKEQREKVRNEIRRDPDLAAAESRFVKEREDRIRTGNARVDAKVAEVRQGSAERTRKVDAIRLEAKRLEEKYAKASPAEKSQIEKHTAELARQLKGLGY